MNCFNRSNQDSTAYDGTDPDAASSEALMAGLDIGIEKLTQGRIAFINFTEQLLLKKVANVFAEQLPRG